MPRANPRINQSVPIESIDRFTLPVRDLAKAELFYIQVLGGDVIDRSAVEMGARAHPAVRISACTGVDLVLVQQPYGWQPVDSSNPHWGFEIPSAELDQWVEHLKEWQVPSAVVIRDADQEALDVPTRAELHFLDPDGNQIELVAWEYPMNDRAWHGQYDPWTLLYNYRDWPPAAARHLLSKSG